MINNLTVTNPQGEELTFELRFPEKSGFLITNIDGLGPVNATINSTELASSDGAIFNSSRIGIRNLVITFVLMPFPTVEASRLLSYRMFPIKKKVKLLIETDNRLCETYGYIESNAPIIFSSMVTCQISIVCPDPYFYSEETSRTIFSSIIPTTEFQLWNDSTTLSLLEFGQVNNLTSGVVYYEGDADVGIIINLMASGVATAVTIFNTTTDESLEIDSTRLAQLTGSGIIAGDEIIISTVKGDKYVALIRGGIEINILNSLTRESDWIHLVRGDNVIGYSAATGVENIQLRVENRILYEGV